MRKNHDARTLKNCSMIMLLIQWMLPAGSFCYTGLMQETIALGGIGRDLRHVEKKTLFFSFFSQAIFF